MSDEVREVGEVAQVEEASEVDKMVFGTLEEFRAQLRKGAGDELYRNPNWTDEQHKAFQEIYRVGCTHFDTFFLSALIVEERGDGSTMVGIHPNTLMAGNPPFLVQDLAYFLVKMGMAAAVVEEVIGMAQASAEAEAAKAEGKVS